MSGGTASNYFVYSLLRARDWQHRPQLDDVCQWWRGGGRGVLALVGMGGAGKTAIAERFLRVLPGGLPDDPDVPKDGSLPTPHGVFVFSFYDAPNPEAFFEALQMWLEHSPRVQTVLSLGQMFYLLQQTPGLLVLDGLEKVQEDGVRGLLGRLASPKLREFLDRIAAGYFPQLSVLVTSRFPLADLRDARPQFFRLLPIDEIERPAGIRLLRARGVRGTDPQLARIVDACGRHALTVDFAGGYIAEFGGGDPATPVDFEMDSARLQEMLDDEPDEARRHVLKQGHRFARLAERYRDAMLGGTDERSDGDAAALALLQRICLFRLGVDAATLANIFTGEQAVKVSGPALAGLSGPQLQKKLDWLVRMRIVESQSQIKNQESKILYTIHPAVRDGFLSGLADDALRENHEAVRQGLAVSLGDAPGENPSDPATLDLLEEIVHHTLQSGHVLEAWDIYGNRIGNYENLGWRLGAYERGERICRAFAGGQTPEHVASSLQDSRLQVSERPPYVELPEATQADFIYEWALYLSELGRLAAAARCYENLVEIELRGEVSRNATVTVQNLSDAWLLSGRLTAGQATAAEALRLAELAGDSEYRYNSHAYGAHAHSLRGEVSSALADFRAAIYWEHEAEGDNYPLMSLHGIEHAHLLARLGRRDEATRWTRRNFEVWSTEYQADGARFRLILSDLHRDAGDLAEAETLLASAHDWAVARDAKIVLCWSALVQARIVLSFAREPTGSAGSGVDRAIAAPALPVGSRLNEAATALRDGLKIARDCGFGLYHIDLLLQRARLHLLSGEPQAALDDLRTALDAGVHGDQQTGQPELLAATHPECGYAWAIAEGLQLRPKRSSCKPPKHSVNPPSFPPTAPPSPLPSATCSRKPNPA
jgi:tetratricopeptide (TPR) repeat protein